MSTEYDAVYSDVQFPQIPHGSRDVKSVVDSNGQLDRIYYVQSEADRTLSLHSLAMRGGHSAGHKKPLRMGQVVARPGAGALYGANEKFLAKVCYAVQVKYNGDKVFRTLCISGSALFYFITYLLSRFFFRFLDPNSNGIFHLTQANF